MPRRDAIIIASQPLAPISERKEPGEVLTFAGVDPNDAGVQVIVRGVPMTDADGQAITPNGPAMLVINYFMSFGSPDVVTVEAGSF